MHTHNTAILLQFHSYTTKLTAHPHFKAFPVLKSSSVFCHLTEEKKKKKKNHNRFYNLITRTDKKNPQFSQNLSEMFLTLQQNGKNAFEVNIPQH